MPEREGPLRCASRCKERALGGVVDEEVDEARAPAGTRGRSERETGFLSPQRWNGALSDGSPFKIKMKE